MTEHLVKIEDVTIGYKRGGQPVPIVKSATLSIAAGQVLALVGESGSGKTLLSKSLLQLLPDGVQVQSGRLIVGGHNVMDMTPKDLNSYRGAVVGMVFQEPLTSLNPALKIGDQLSEGLRLHTDMGAKEQEAACIAMLERVKIRNPEQALKAYPHEFSGGMRQRIMLASVMLLRPALLVADEPTTALDVMIQREIMDIMMELCRDQNTALLLISHDLALVSQYADQVAVMEKGVIVEEGLVENVLTKPQHSYTKKLIAAVPGQAGAQSEKNTAAETVLKACDVAVHFPIESTKSFWKKPDVLRAVKGVSVSVNAGETVALVGESGSGKSTLGRAILNMVPVKQGLIEFDGVEIAASDKTMWRNLRSKMQFIFQDPFSSLDPRMRVGDIICEGLTDLKAEERQARLDTILPEVGLSAEYKDRYPHELSGGQRQRVCIARALIMEPSFVVADEPVSALDVTVQTQILQLLRLLQQRKGFACLFITHDLAVVEDVADRIMVMYHGCILEEGRTADVLTNPQHPYTRALLEAAPKFGKKSKRRALEYAPVSDLKGHDYLPLDAAQHDLPAVGHRQFIEVSNGHKVACIPHV